MGLFLQNSYSATFFAPDLKFKLGKSQCTHRCRVPFTIPLLHGECHCSFFVVHFFREFHRIGLYLWWGNHVHIPTPLYELRFHMSEFWGLNSEEYKIQWLFVYFSILIRSLLKLNKMKKKNKKTSTNLDHGILEDQYS